MFRIKEFLDFGRNPRVPCHQEDLKLKGKVYILDEPENSMSCEYQMKLAEYLSLVAMGGSQLIIATHSPFLLSIPNAKIYNLDAAPATLSKWNELENMKHYFTLFEKHREAFL